MSNPAITDAINAGRRQLIVTVRDAETWARSRTLFQTSSNVQEYDIGKTVLRILAALYDVAAAASPVGAYDDKVTHGTGSVTVSGLAGLTPSQWVGGRIHMVKSGTYYSALITANDATTLTISIGTDLPDCTDNPAILVTAPANTARQSTTVEMADLETAQKEEAVLRDPLDAPSITNPKYRMTNKKFRVITSTDGSVASGKWVQVEYLGELTDLSADGDSSDLPMTLDELVVDWAVYLMCVEPLPEIATIAVNEFYRKANVLNGGNNGSVKRNA
jgi:hypothetical protein